jgi:hypothetical protein
MKMNLPTIAILDQGGDIGRVQVDVATLVEDYTQSELSVIAALLKVAASKVAEAEMELSFKTAKRPMPVHPHPFV